jgi:glutaminyl-tRNA synthetase
VIGLDIPYTIFLLSCIAFGTFRYDDTNPEAEKKEYIDHIEEIVQWMGWKPFKVCFFCTSFVVPTQLKKMFKSFTFVQITYTSDYFQELYDLAVELIRRGCAYVDHQVGILPNM